MVRYQAQVTLLTSMLRNSAPDLEIGTVDGMQGRGVHYLSGFTDE